MELLGSQVCTAAQRVYSRRRIDLVLRRGRQRQLVSFVGSIIFWVHFVSELGRCAAAGRPRVQPRRPIVLMVGVSQVFYYCLINQYFLGL